MRWLLLLLLPLQTLADCQFQWHNYQPATIESGAITVPVVDTGVCEDGLLPPVVTVTPASASINLGDSVTINWQSSHADSCIKTGDWSGTVALSGSETVTPQNLGSFSYGVECSNANGTDSGTTQVMVGDGLPAYCASIPTFGLVEQHTPETYEDATGYPWPGIVGDSDFWSIYQGKYVALSFVATTEPGTLVFVDGRPREGPPAAYTVKLSRCPGDFTHNPFSSGNDYFCIKGGASSANIKWSTVTNQETGRCPLHPGVRYYLNVVHGGVSLDNQTFTNYCNAPFCSTAMQRTE